MNEKLFDIIKYAYNNSDFYKEKLRSIFEKNIDEISLEEFKTVDCVSRLDLINNVSDILSYDYKYLNRKDLITERTSGSTGENVTVYWKHSDWIKSNYYLWEKRHEWYGIKPSDKMCTFHTRTNIGRSALHFDNRRIIRSHAQLSFSAVNFNEDDLEEYYNEIIKFRPTWFMMAPTIGLKFVEYCKAKDFMPPPSVKYVELFGEMVSEGIRNNMGEFFNNAKIAVMYGAKEVNGIAYTCPCGKMHVLNENVHIDVDEDDNIILTNLVNEAFPIIRYKIGDKVKVSNCEKCDCGTNGLIIDKILGKSTRLEYLDKKSGITYYLLSNVIDNVDAMFDHPILQYKVLFGKHPTIMLYCRENYKNWHKTISDEIRHKVDSIIKNCELFIQFSESPLNANSATGKLDPMEI